MSDTNAPFIPTPQHSSPLNPLDYAVSKRDADILSMVAEAIHHKQAILAYQPVVNAEGRFQVAFYEGLVRLQDATGRIIPARDFVPVIEDTELGREVDTLALILGCKALNDVPSLRLAVNMSAQSMAYTPWLRALEHWTKHDPSIGPRLILEITESSAMVMPELVVDFMDRLQNKGICFALDDFGAGYTALRYFKDFFFDILKLDGQFVSGIADDPDNHVLAQAMTTIGKQFDMLVVAEMVETPRDAEILREIGVDCMQGFLFGAPTTRPHWITSDEDRAAASK
ncbi:MAG: EAL domain-containing protein [Paracoccaceae bacterium]